MANNYLSLATTVVMSAAEGALLLECAEVSSELECGFPEDIDTDSYAGRSQAFRDTFPPKPEEEDPYASFYDLFDDKDFPSFNAEFTKVGEPDGKVEIYIAGDQADPNAIANVLQAVAKSALPLAIEWATTCDKLRPGEFGGGYYIITEDAITGGSTHWLASQELAKLKAA